MLARLTENKKRDSDSVWRVDKFIVKSNITSNKLQNFETVSRRSHHRSNHTQKLIKAKVLEPHPCKYEGQEEGKDAGNDEEGDLAAGPGKLDRLQLVSAL